MKLTIKRLMILALALVMVLSLCACGGNDRDDDDDDDDDDKGSSFWNGKPTEPTDDGSTYPIVTEPLPTEPPVPTAEEQALLDAYAEIVDFKLNISDYYQEAYEQLTTMDLTVIDKWMGTEYLDPAINWDYNTILAGFTVLENVKLEEHEFTTDHLGNESERYYYVSWEYNEDGLVCNDWNGSFAISYGADLLTRPRFDKNGQRQYVFDDNGRITGIRYGRGSDDDFTVEYLLTYVFDENGNIVEEVLTDTSGNSKHIYHTYNEKNQRVETRDQTLSSYLYIDTYTYDDAGNLIGYEYSHYIAWNNKLFSKDIWEYTYDANGILVSATRRYEQWAEDFWTGNFFMDKHQTDLYTFTCDAEGNILQADVTYGDIFTSDNGTEYTSKQPSNPTSKVVFTYGDYVIYTPAQ